MLNRLDLLDSIKARLGYPVVDLAITDEMILKQVDFAIKKLIPYLNNIEVLTVNSKTIKFEDKHIYSVIRVEPAEDNEQRVVDKSIAQGFYIMNTSTKSLVNCALWNYYADTIQSDLDQIGFRFLGDTLYIDGGNPPYSVEAITDESISNMTDDYVNWCLDYSVALVKCIEGEIRSKIKITGSPVETNGAELKSEGITEKKELEEKLGTITHSLFYATR